MIYEIINPSDAVTFETDSDTVAGLAVLLLGQGMYGCERDGEEGEVVRLPTLLLGGGDDQLDCALSGLGLPPGEDTKARLDAALAAHALAMADALETLVYAKAGMRRAVLAALEGLPDQKKRLYRLNDERRSSLNDINKAGRAWAKILREKHAQRTAAAAVAVG